MIVYTCITSKIDELPEPRVTPPDCQFICFSDTNWQSDTWQIRQLLKDLGHPTLTARYHKTQAPLFLDGNKFMWQDGKVIFNDPLPLFQNLEGFDFVFYAHPVRNCVYEEARRVIELGKDDACKVKLQMKRYAEANHVTKQLFETCVFLVNKSEKAESLLNKWWHEISTNSYRDQLSLPFVIQESDVRYRLLKNPYTNSHFTVRHHSFNVVSISLL